MDILVPRGTVEEHPQRLCFYSYCYCCCCCGRVIARIEIIKSFSKKKVAQVFFVFFFLFTLIIAIPNASPSLTLWDGSRQTGYHAANCHGNLIQYA